MSSFPSKFLLKGCLVVVFFVGVLYTITGKERLRNVIVRSVNAERISSSNYSEICDEDCNAAERNLLANSSTNFNVSSREIEESNRLHTKSSNMTSSYCSEAASRRGLHQHVVSFSFFGSVNHSRNYFEGIEENAKLIQKFYPGWIMRVYQNILPEEVNTSTTHCVYSIPEGLSNSTTDGAECENIGMADRGTTQGKIRYLDYTYPNLDFCFVDAIQGFGNLSEYHPMTWRFLSMADPLVDVFLSRDLDSRISEREQAAVNEWLTSNLTFHIMRDHPGHIDTILGGMWGAYVDKERNLLADTAREIIKEGENHYHYGWDQRLLKDILWPTLKGNVMQHDSYHCQNFSSHGNMRPWPTERERKPYNFVGSPYGLYPNPMLTECPSQCRPKDKQDWLYC